MKRLMAALLLSSLVSLGASAATAPKPAGKPAGKPATKSATKSAAGEKKDSKFGSSTFSGVPFRSIGPAVTSGRIVDLAVNPTDKRVWYVASAYGGVWKTVNAGTSFTPIFDTQGTPSIGCVTLDPSDPLTVWVGSGENNSQRAVGWGDGVYRSDDGGKSWKNMGLKSSEHIGAIVVHPSNSDIVWVAAQGPLWAPGGDRGVYKTTDGGKNWKRVLDVDQWTGANEIHLDPRNPNVMFASTYQRHRKVWTLLDGGPGSGIWKSTDGGETWKKLTNGLPSEDMGRIGMDVSPTDPGAVVATIEAAAGAGGTYRTNDGGANWEKLNSYVASSPQYYQEVTFDPTITGRLYLVDTFLQTSDDGGRSWHRAGESHKHVDNHAVWIDPDDSRHLLVGCDGGLYESFDRCATWNFFPNLPLTQFYKLEVDNDTPFYNVYGGTQDNATWGGPSRTINDHGIRNSDWWTVVGGDGFQPRVDPTDPNVVYGEYQHAGLVRFDRRNGEQVDIQPQPEPGEPGMRWNWDTPLVISPHLHTRLYFAAQRVYRSEDRGNAWKAISPDLTRQVDRNRLKVMGRVWGVDAVAKNASTSFYGNIVALDESPMQEGLLYVGTDDGLIQVSENAGTTWRRFDTTPLGGEYAYVSRVIASRHAKARVYTTLDRHKMGDFKPYVFRSEDMGRSWRSISGDLPAGGSVYCFVEDTRDPDLLFAGTEFGLFFTQDGGKKWIALKGGIPIQCIRDVTIQRRDDDLVVATFGRGFYILDDLSPLRVMKEKDITAEATILPVRKSWMYVASSPMGGQGKAEQGERFYVAPNPPLGATFTYWLRDELKGRKDARREKEKEVEKAGGDTYYPSWDSLRAEEREEEPALLLLVTDEQGHVVRRLKGATSSGLHRTTWDMRWPSSEPTTLGGRSRRDFEDSDGGGPLAAPGTYRVQLARRVDGRMTTMGEARTFTLEPLANATLPAGDRAALAAFHAKEARLQRAATGTSRALGEAQNRIANLKQALDDTPGAPVALREQVSALERRLADLSVEMTGDPVLGGHNEPSPPALMDRVGLVTGGAWYSTTEPTATHRRAYEIASADLEKVIAKLRAAVDDLAAIEKRAEAAGAPWTPGRIPEWKPE